MIELTELKYCPRTKHSPDMPLKRPRWNCRCKGSSWIRRFPNNEGHNEDECEFYPFHLKYMEANGIAIHGIFSIYFRCVLSQLSTSKSLDGDRAHDSKDSASHSEIAGNTVATCHDKEQAGRIIQSDATTSKAAHNTVSQEQTGVVGSGQPKTVNAVLQPANSDAGYESLRCSSVLHDKKTGWVSCVGLPEPPIVTIPALRCG